MRNQTPIQTPAVNRENTTRCRNDYNKETNTTKRIKQPNKEMLQVAQSTMGK